MLTSASFIYYTYASFFFLFLCLFGNPSYWDNTIKMLLPATSMLFAFSITNDGVLAPMTVFSPLDLTLQQVLQVHHTLITQKDNYPVLVVTFVMVGR